MASISNCRNRVLQIAAAIFAIIAFVSSARADIFQWEYINPGDPSQGKRQSTRQAPGGVGVNVGPGADLAGRDLSMAYFIGANLTNANLASRIESQGRGYVESPRAGRHWYNFIYFRDTRLSEADFTGAEIRGANFSRGYCRLGTACSHSPGWNVGITVAQLYSTASYHARDLRGIDLTDNVLAGGNFSAQNLTGSRFYLAALTDAEFQHANLTDSRFGFATLANANFSGANLTNASFAGATLSDAEFTGADVRGVNFGKEIVDLHVRPDPPNLIELGTGISLEQLYSTASYRAKDLTGINLSLNSLGGGNFVGQNLTNSRFGNRYYEVDYGWRVDYATLSGADFTGADIRGAIDVDFSDTTTSNLIWPSGHIDGLDLDGGGRLVVRDYDGDPTRTDPVTGTPAPLSPVPITVNQQLTMGPHSTLRMVFEADAWNSTISFAPGIPIMLGGTLELTFAEDVNLAGQVGRTFDLFDWTGVNPTGGFVISGPHTWDLSPLYTTGEVTLLSIPEPTTLLLFGFTLTAHLAFGHVRYSSNSTTEGKLMKAFKTTLILLTFAVVQFLGANSAAAPAVVGLSHYTDRFGMHSIPGLPIGDKVQINAFIETIDSQGSPMTSVEALQGGTMVALDPLISPLYPPPFHPYQKYIDFDPGLLGSWEIIPTDSSGIGPSAFTNAITEPQFVPLVDDITVGGSPVGASLSWELPNLVGFDVDLVFVRIIEAETGTDVYVSGPLPFQTTSFGPPAGVLQYGVDYVYRIMLNDFEGVDPEVYPENRSNTFSEPFRHTFPGDFNTDGTVDAADYIVWRKGLGTTYTQTDYDAWRANFGRSAAGAAAVADTFSAASSANIPEPTSLALAALAFAPALLSLGSRRRIPRDPRHAIEVGVVARQVTEDARLHHGYHQGITAKQAILLAQCSRSHHIRQTNREHAHAKVGDFVYRLSEPRQRLQFVRMLLQLIGNASHRPAVRIGRFIGH
jgi:uncharacterized protein YjbI with pentapeptide repeats